MDLPFNDAQKNVELKVLQDDLGVEVAETGWANLDTPSLARPNYLNGAARSKLV
jgi:hypothetical protein